MKAAGPLLDDHRLFHGIVARLCRAGLAEEDISWSETCLPPTNAEHFAREAIFVICNSGMQNKIARQIFDRCMNALDEERPVSDVFGHEGKVRGIEDVWARRVELHAGYLQAEDKVAYCRTLPWIGGITSYHLAKNFGAQVAKPDVHLQRLADRHGTSCQELCEILAERTGFKIATVDVILWRACAERIIDGRTGTYFVEERRPQPRVVQQHELFQPVQQELFG